jgi:hypothetical protein
MGWETAARRFRVRLEAREGSTQAEMSPVTESQVAFQVGSVEIEYVWIGELARVPVGGAP